MGKTTKVIHEKIRASYPCLYLQSPEEEAGLNEVSSVLGLLKAEKKNRRKIIWTFGKGMVDPSIRVTARTPTGGLIADTVGPIEAFKVMLTEFQKAVQEGRCPAEQPTVYVFRQLHHFLVMPEVQILLLDLLPLAKKLKHTIIIVSAVVNIPPELEKEISLIELGYPDADVRDQVLSGIVPTLPKEVADLLTPELRAELVDSSAGMTANESENAFSLSVIRAKIENSSYWNPKTVTMEKMDALKKARLLEFTPVENISMGDIGGMENYKSWLRLFKDCFSQRARDFGISAPKGVLMVGPPGCGKSATAKATAAELHLPLLRLDIGRLFGGLVGQSEANVRQALQIAEAMAPAVLWVDEAEKGFAGVSGSQGDSGVGARVFGTLLTWLQEKTAPIFTYFTMNDVAGIPPELLRKGRFDELFSVMLPTESERALIFNIHLTKRLRQPDRKKLIGSVINPKELALQTDGFSGAEIEAVVESALRISFFNGHELSMADLHTAVYQTVPLSKSDATKLQRVVEWCKTRTRSANASEKEAEFVKAAGGRTLDA